VSLRRPSLVRATRAPGPKLYISSDPARIGARRVPCSYAPSLPTNAGSILTLSVVLKREGGYFILSLAQRYARHPFFFDFDFAFGEAFLIATFVVADEALPEAGVKVTRTFSVTLLCLTSSFRSLLVKVRASV